MTDVSIGALEKSYGAARVLRGIDLHVPAGSLTVVLGPSGCGKTTLLRLIAGFDRPDHGTIRIGGKTVYEAGRSTPPDRRHVGYVAQEGALFPHLDVAANVTFGLSGEKPGRLARAADLLGLVGLDDSYAARYPHQLSGGQQQRVAVARALARRPGVLLLDEPFSSLDAGLRDGTRRAVAGALAAAGTTSILVTHDQAEALSLATQVAVMLEGRLVQVGSPSDVYRYPASIAVGALVGEVVLLPATLGRGSADCALGRLAVHTPHSPIQEGQGTVLIRPEQIVVDAGTSGGTEDAGTPARVLSTTYFGRDATVRLALAAADRSPSPTVVTARVPGHAVPPVGAETHLAVRGAVMAYPALPAVQPEARATW